MRGQVVKGCYYSHFRTVTTKGYLSKTRVRVWVDAEKHEGQIDIRTRYLAPPEPEPRYTRSLLVRNGRELSEKTISFKLSTFYMIDEIIGKAISRAMTAAP